MTNAVFTGLDRGIDILVNAVLESRKPLLASVEGKDSVEKVAFLLNLENKLRYLGLMGKVVTIDVGPIAREITQCSYWIVTGDTLLREDVDRYFKEHFGKKPDKYVSLIENATTVAVQDD